MEVDELDEFPSEAGPSHFKAEHEEPNGDGNEEDDYTIEKILHTLENAWLNEKSAPELLPHCNEVIECMLQQISYLENNLQKIDKKDIRYNIHTMEISRIRFIISSYLRKRLEKIEEYAIYLLSEDNKRNQDEKFMTPSEEQYAKEFVANMESLFTNVALKHMPERIGKFEVDKMTTKPNMNKYVFVKSNKTVKGIYIPDSEEVEDFHEGSQFIMQYSVVEHLVKNGSVQLI